MMLKSIAAQDTNAQQKVHSLEYSCVLSQNYQHFLEKKNMYLHLKQLSKELKNGIEICDMVPQNEWKVAFTGTEI